MSARWLRLRGTLDQVRRLEGSQWVGWSQEILDLVTQPRPTFRPRPPWPGVAAARRRLAALFPSLAPGAGPLDVADDVLAAADDLCAGWAGIGGSQIPVADLVAPAAAGLDVEIEHSCERAYWLTPLALCHAATGRRDVVERGAVLLDDWIDGAPAPARWAPMNVAERLLQWCIFIAAAGPAVGVERQSRWLASAQLQARWLHRRLERRGGNNHLLFDARGLLLAAWVLVEIDPEAPRWHRAGTRLLARQMDRQFSPEGAHLEACPGYHLWAMQCLAESAVLCRLLGEASLSSRITELVEAARDILSGLVAADGRVAALGDAKDWDVQASPADFGVCASGSSLPPGHWSFLWRPAPSPPPHAKQATAAQSSTGPAMTTGHVPAPGWLWARWPSPVGASHLLARVGPLSGLPANPGHAHGDVLAFLLWWRGAALFVDAGCSTYDAGPERHRERSAAAHNTVGWEHSDQALFWRAFRTAFLPAVTVHRVAAQTDCIGFTATCQIRAPGRGHGARHTRQLRAGADLVVLRDTVATPTAQAATWTFLVDGRWTPRTAADQVILAAVADGHCRRLALAAFEETDTGLVPMAIGWTQSLRAIGFGRREPAWQLSVRREVEADTPATLVFALAETLTEDDTWSAAPGDAHALRLRLGERRWSLTPGLEFEACE